MKSYTLLIEPLTSVNPQWASPARNFNIGTNSVHVWLGRFDSDLLADREFGGGLSDPEKQKAQSFVRQYDRDRYVFTHGMLRQILARYVGCEPGEIVFETNYYGKPFLALPGQTIDIQFNLSHSHDVILIAVARGAAVGVDVEQIRNIQDAGGIIESSFSSIERQYLGSLSHSELTEAFFICWTLKEAFAKGLGLGLSYSFDKFSVISPCLRIETTVYPYLGSGRSCGWKIFRLSPEAGYAGALAVKVKTGETKFYEYRHNILTW